MAFHTWQFGVFLVLVLAAFWLLAAHRNARSLLLLVASYVFYASWEPWFLLLILFSTVLDYHAARWMADAKTPGVKRAALLASLGGNLLLLGYFKYSRWSWELLQPVLPAGELNDSLEALAWSAVVPVGISFYTFQTLSYTIDVYRGTLAPARNMLDFALFVSFFPQLVAGPIVRASTFLPQLELTPRFDRARLHDGIYRIVIGLAKKALLADTLAQYLVDPVHTEPQAWAPWIHVLAIYGFAFQIYLDFSGYSDIAIGTARLFGFDLPENFLSPMKTLSFWVRDYIYFPLGGSRGREARVICNLLITMVVIGLWHGASVLWLLYGLAQGVAMALERWFERLRGGAQFATTPMRSALSWAITISFVAFTSLAVRGESLQSVWRVLTVFGEGETLSIWAWVALGVAVLTHFQPKGFYKALRRRAVEAPTLVQGFAAGVVVGALIFVMSESNAFIYFQF